MAQLINPVLSKLLVTFLLSSSIIVTTIGRVESSENESKFSNPEDFEGWNCGKITTCGVMGQICGGYNVKGKESDIKKTFNLPAGTYSVELDFIKIDSWFVRVRETVSA